MDIKVFEKIKENKEDIFKIIDYIANFGITNVEDIEALYLSDKFRESKVLKTYDEWNKLGYSIKRGEHGIKLFKGKSIKEPYFDISQVVEYKNSAKDIKRGYFKDPTVLFENEGEAMLYHNYIDNIRKDIKGDYSDYDKQNMDLLITRAIFKRYDVYLSSRFLTDNSEKEFLLACIKDLKFTMFNDNDTFTKMLAEISRLSYEKMVKLHLEGIKNNMLENRILDKSKTIYYTINSDKSQETIQMEERKEGANYERNNQNQYAVYGNGNNVSRAGEENGNIDTRNMALAKEEYTDGSRNLYKESGRILRNDENISKTEQSDDGNLERSVRNGRESRNDEILGHMGERDGQGREIKTSSGRNITSTSESKIFNNAKDNNGQGENRQSIEDERRRSIERIGGNRFETTKEQVESITNIYRNTKGQTGIGINQESKPVNGNGQIGENGSTANSQERDDTGNNDNANIEEEIGEDKTPIFDGVYFDKLEMEYIRDVYLDMPKFYSPEESEYRDTLNFLYNQIIDPIINKENTHYVEFNENYDAKEVFACLNKLLNERNAESTVRKSLISRCESYINYLNAEEIDDYIKPKISENVVNVKNKVIKIDEDNFYKINKQNRSGLSLGIDKERFIRFLEENKEVINNNNKLENYKEQTVVAHIFNPYGVGDWLITGFEKYGEDIILHGWANLGNDQDAEFGDVSLNELLEVGNKKGLPFEVETNSFDFGKRYVDIVKENKRAFGLDNIINENDIKNIIDNNIYNIELKQDYDTCLKRLKNQVDILIEHYNSFDDKIENELIESIEYYKNKLYNEDDKEKLDNVINKHINTILKKNAKEKLNVVETVENNLNEENTERDVLLSKDFVNTEDKDENNFPLKQKFEDNINAIKTLKQIESENREATKEEQKILSKYVGWGGLANYGFDEIRSKKENYDLLKELLTDEEYRDAKASTTSAYFTPDYVVKAIYSKIGDFGFTGGKILEPSCGTGKFFSNMPKEIRENSQIVGIEKDSISARISKLLYPSMTIKCKGFEKEKIKNNTYNLVIGNIPFGEIKLHDTEYNKDNLLIHDYFINKSLDKLADGGICAIITSTGTLDKRDDKARSLFSEKANFLGSIRLPSGTFGDTKASCDILFFQKDTKNKKGLNQDFVKSESIYNSEKDHISQNYEEKYKNQITNEIYNYERIDAQDVMTKDMWNDLFVGIKQTDEKNIDPFTEEDYEDSWIYADEEKLKDLKEKYIKWTINGKDINNKPYDIKKDFYVLPYRSDFDAIKEIKEHKEYEIFVGKENPKYYTYETNDKGKIKQIINEDVNKYIYNEKPDIKIETTTDIIDNNEYSKKFFDISLNNYYKNSPDNIIGELSTDTGQFGRPEILSKMNNSEEIKNKLIEKLNTINCTYREQIEEKVNEKEVEKTYISDNEYESNSLYNLKKYSHFVYNDKVCFKENDSAYYIENLSKTNEGIMKSLIKMKDLTHKILQHEVKNQIEDADKLRIELLNTYNNFYDTYNERINGDTIKKLIDGDDDKGLLLSLEIGNDEPVENFKIKKNAFKGNLEDADIVETKTLSNGINVSVILDKDGEEHYYDNDKNEHLIKVKTEYHFEKLAQIFTERVIKNKPELKNINNSKDGMIASLQTIGKIDLDFIEEKTKISKEQIINELKGQIYYDLNENDYVPRDEFLSGNVLQKIENHENYIKGLENEKIILKDNLTIAENENNDENIKSISKQLADIDNNISVASENIADLKGVIPEKISFEDINIGLGSTWLPLKYYNKFIEDIFDYRCQKNSYSSYGCKLVFKEKLSPPEFFIENKNYTTNDNTELLYGTEDKKSLEILESALNLKPIQVSDRVRGEDGKYKYIVNPEKTSLANEKVETIKKAFLEWKENKLTDSEKQEIEELYNRKFNCIVSRKFDGNILDFPEMNANITLNEHQKNGVARMVFGRNTGLAHCVGSGKTYEIVAGCMKFKQLGLANKSMIVVPKPIVEQWQREFMTLYPTANIIAPNENDFTKENRMKFLNKIATGNYDAIILSQEQFQKIPLSKERQERYLNKQIDDYEEYLSELKNNTGNGEYNKMRSTVKSIQKQIDSLKTRLEELKNENYKDNVVCFEELGIDKLFVDEAHYYKNSFYPTKLTRVAGIQSSNTKRTFDLQMKCKYLNEKTNYKGVYLATGTPMTNSIVELYTMMKYLQDDKLNEVGLNTLDDYVANFCEIKTIYELDTTGGGNYHQKTRVCGFTNVPEIIRLYKESWDVVNTEDIKGIKLPKANYKPVELNATDMQKKLMESFKERCEYMDNNKFDPKVDNKLKLTNDGKLSAISPKLYDPALPDEEGNKPNACVDIVAKVYFDTMEEKGTQMIFSDLGVPKEGKKYDIYNDIKNKLIKKGLKKEEIQFIGSYDTPEKKQQMQDMMREGKIRVLISSTDKGGTGLNVQNRMKALHHISLPWKPADMIQREGRLVRQGNMYDDVDIYTYVSKGTFDARTFELLGFKKQMIDQIFKSDLKVRKFGEDYFKSEDEISYEDFVQMALPDSNLKKIKEKERQIKLLEAEERQFNTMSRTNRKKLEEIPIDIKQAEEIKALVEKDIKNVSKMNFDTDTFKIKIYGINIGDEKEYTDKQVATDLLYNRIYKDDKNIFYRSGTLTKVAEYKGFEINVVYDMTNKNFTFRAKSLETGFLYSYIDLGNSAIGNMTRIDNFIKSLDENRLMQHENKIKHLYLYKENLEKSLSQIFTKKEELENAKKELKDLLNENDKQNAIEKEKQRIHNNNNEPKLKQS